MPKLPWAGELPSEWIDSPLVDGLVIKQRTPKQRILVVATHTQRPRPHVSCHPDKCASSADSVVPSGGLQHPRERPKTLQVQGRTWFTNALHLLGPESFRPISDECSLPKSIVKR